MIDSDLFYVAQFEIVHSFSALQGVGSFSKWSNELSKKKKKAVINRQTSAKEFFLDFTQ